MPRLSLIALCVVCHVLPLAVGCGGGDDDPTPDAGPTPIPPPPDAGPPDAGSRPDAGPTDLTPPSVVSHVPANNAVAVPPESVIEVTFSEQMQTERGFLNLQPAAGLPNNGTVTVRAENWDAARRKATFSFPQGLPLRTKLTATVANFADVAGNPLPQATTFSFTVSDGQPPRVTASSPTEGSNQGVLTTSQVSFTFNEPMDTTVGSFTPSGGITLGPLTWTGTTAVSAPITGGLTYNGTYSVRLNNFRNSYLTPLDGTQYLSDGKLDFFTGPDMDRPRVLEASPAEGATGVMPENTSFIVFTFSEPMEKTVGRAELIDSSGTTVLTANWATDGLSVSYDVRNRLRYNAVTRVVLTGFKDRVGNLLDPMQYLGDGELDFQTGADAVKPYVETSTPQEGAQDVYPVEVFVTGSNPPTAYRKVFTFRFSEPMDISVRRVVLRETSNPAAARNLDGVWSNDALTLTVTITPPSGGTTPLLPEYFYSLDLTGLRDRNGATLDPAHPNLGDGKLDFYTMANSPGLNHACEHALLQNSNPVTATSTAANAPRTDTIHTRYGVVLPSNGTSFSGFVRMELATDLFHTIYMDRNVPLVVTDAATGTPRQVTQVDVPPACAPILHSATFQSPSNPTANVRFGPSVNSTVRYVLEQGF
jgi:hypothetical protein